MIYKTKTSSFLDTFHRIHSEELFYNLIIFQKQENEKSRDRNILLFSEVYIPILRMLKLHFFNAEEFSLHKKETYTYESFLYYHVYFLVILYNDKLNIDICYKYCFDCYYYINLQKENKRNIPCS